MRLKIETFLKKSEKSSIVYPIIQQSTFRHTMGELKQSVNKTVNAKRKLIKFPMSIEEV